MTARALRRQRAARAAPPDRLLQRDGGQRRAASCERQRNFLADASHQLRNPLSALLLRLDSLALRAPEGCEAEVDAAASEGRHLAGILERLLHLAQAEEAEPLPERIDLAPIVERRIEAWWPAATPRG